MWKSYLLCFQSTFKWWEELPKSEKVNTRNYLGDGMIPLLSLWKTFHPANGSEITAFYLQKTHGQYFTMDSEGHLQKLPISTLWCLICPWQGNTTGRCTFPCHFFDQGRKWWNSFNYHSHQWCHWENLIASYWTRGHLTGNQERSTATPTDAIHHLWMARVCKKLPSELWNYRDELSMEQGITLKNHHIIVPETFQMTFLEFSIWSPGNWEMSTSSKRIYLSARDYRTDPEHCGKMWNMPMYFPCTEETSTDNRWGTALPMAHTWNGLLLLEMWRLPGCWRLILKVPDSEETSKWFHQCCC